MLNRKKSVKLNSDLINNYSINLKNDLKKRIFMYYLGYSTPLSSKTNQKNINLIIDFKEEPTARITSVNGSLNKYYSYSLGVVSYTFMAGTSLKATMEVIKKSAAEYFDVMKDQNPESSEEENNLIKIKNASDLLFTCHKFSKGLKKIQKVYNDRYQTNANCDGLDDLNKYVKDFKKTEMALFEKLKNLQKSEINKPQSNLIVSEEILINKKETEAFNLDQYISSFCTYPVLDKETVLNLIQEGKDIFSSIMNGSKPQVSEDPQIAQEELAKLTWFLMDASISKNQGYNEGAFMIEDPENKLFNFLQSKELSYSRPSSHLKNRVSEEGNYGIDVLNGLMPANKRTLLFAKVKHPTGKELLFIKPENFSADKTKLYDLTWHSYEFIMAQYNKRMYPGCDDLPAMKKERVPVNVVEAFKPLVTENQKEIEKEVKNWGISYMYPYAEKLKKDLLNDDSKSFNLILKYLQFVNFLKEHRDSFVLNKEEDEQLFNTLIRNEDHLSSIINKSIDPLAVLQRFTAILPQNLNNFKLNDLLSGLDLENYELSLPKEDKDLDTFSKLLNFYVSLEDLDHLQDRTGREVYFDMTELQQLCNK